MFVYTDGDYAFRPVTEDDLLSLAAHRNNPGTWRNLTSVLPILPYKQKDWLRSLSDKNIYFISGVKTGSFTKDFEDIGLARITEIDWINRNACIGIDIFEYHRGLGHGKATFKLLLDYCFDVLGLYRVWLLVAEFNAPAIHIYESAGMRHEGKMVRHLYRDGKYYDYILMGLLREEYGK